MKKQFFLIVISLLHLQALADSPITSTGFSAAYLDVPEVARAAETHRMSEPLATYLINDLTPIDRAAAVINAISWDIDGKATRLEFEQILQRAYPGVAATIGTPGESGRLLFLRGYMQAMDDYFRVDEASRLVQRASEKLPDDFTVALVSTLVLTQDDQVYSWCDRYRMPTAVVEQYRGRENMRPEAVDIIMEYMNLYKDYCAPGDAGHYSDDERD